MKNSLKIALVSAGVVAVGVLVWNCVRTRQIIDGPFVFEGGKGMKYDSYNNKVSFGSAAGTADVDSSELMGASKMNQELWCTNIKTKLVLMSNGTGQDPTVGWKVAAYGAHPFFSGGCPKGTERVAAIAIKEDTGQGASPEPPGQSTTFYPPVGTYDIYATLKGDSQPFAKASWEIAQVGTTAFPRSERFCVDTEFSWPGPDIDKPTKYRQKTDAVDWYIIPNKTAPNLGVKCPEGYTEFKFLVNARTQ